MAIFCRLAPTYRRGCRLHRQSIICKNLRRQIRYGSHRRHGNGGFCAIKPRDLNNRFALVLLQEREPALLTARPTRIFTRPPADYRSPALAVATSSERLFRDGRIGSPPLTVSPFLTCHASPQAQSSCGGFVYTTGCILPSALRRFFSALRSLRAALRILRSWFHR